MEIVVNLFMESFSIGFGMFKNLFIIGFLLIGVLSTITILLFKYKTFKENITSVPLKVFIDGAFEKAKEYKINENKSQQNMQ